VIHSSAERFLRKTLNAPHPQTPRVVNIDKNAAYPPAVEALKADEQLPLGTQLRQVKYLNNRVEQDHRFIKPLTKPGIGFGSFNTTRRTLRGFEAMNMIRKGQVQAVKKGDVRASSELVSQLFGIAQ
jgi:transposase-like protein